MKKPEEYLENLQKNNIKVLRRYIPKVESGVSVKDVYKVIKQAQIDAIDAAVKMCANLSELIYVECESEIPEGALSTGDPEYGYHYVDIIKIFNVADKLKKELE